MAESRDRGTTISSKKVGRSKPATPAPRGPVVLNGAMRRERVFGGPTPDGPLPGNLLVLLSRLHRAEAAPRDRGER